MEIEQSSTTLARCPLAFGAQPTASKRYEPPVRGTAPSSGETAATTHRRMRNFSVLCGSETEAGGDGGLTHPKRY
ncbi:hypothetical protein BS329_33660 [Amycolatopsis coloradensis]|uniref:Uncharacterized protein n=1 Tax=Amycolatopsis coloradensis TaxID=76021 RepID=A0A1R0KHZ3_9PSEU|nr:hypothetical protein [Amycolatopsis coloradensis]OLZ45380.1 hypothetical protein BS329_33660 [Amycolatopsis coloradensis]